jgi:hypothetical protein
MILRRLFGRREPDQQPRVEQARALESVTDADQLIVNELRGLGADLEQPREIVHYVYFPSEAAARTANQELRQAGYAADVRFAAGPPGANPWLVLATKEEVLSAESARAARDEVRAVAAAHGGEYDGWEAAATP